MFSFNPPAITLSQRFTTLSTILPSLKSSFDFVTQILEILLSWLSAHSIPFLKSGEETIG